jgi:hypothetical protein
LTNGIDDTEGSTCETMANGIAVFMLVLTVALAAGSSPKGWTQKNRNGQQNDNDDRSNDMTTFNTRHNGLDRSLPDTTDPGYLIIHGSHCFKILNRDLEEAGMNDADALMKQMHTEHCKGMLEAILGFIEQNPSLSVNPWICDALDSRNRGKGHAADGALDHDSAYDRLLGQNYISLLMKNFTRSSALSDEEKVYLEKMKSPDAAKLGALGAYCAVKGDIGQIRDLLAKKPLQTGNH